jgi:hypothetical protein
LVDEQADKETMRQRRRRLGVRIGELERKAVMAQK